MSPLSCLCSELSCLSAGSLLQTDEDDGMDEDEPGPSGRKAVFGASVEDIW